MTSYFWQEKALHEMSSEEWESLCDGCAKCCLVQLEDEDTEQLVFTDVACDLLDAGACRCTDYQNRSVRVPNCMTLTPENVEQAAEFAPSSCAYKRLVEGDDLPEWHHLITGSKEAMHTQGLSVQNKVRKLSEVNAENLESFVVEWPLDS